MRARVGLVLPDGTEAGLHPGDLIGRSHAAALRLQDPRVSEAHALVSLRGGVLKLLGLRGRLAVGTSPLTEVTLAPGQEVWLARGVSLGVSSVEVPDHALALEGEGLSQPFRETLRSPSASLQVESALRLVPGYVDEAPAYVWSDGEGWWVRIGAEAPLRLTEGVGFGVAGHDLRVVREPLDRLAAPSTRLQGALHAPLRIVVHYDTAAVHRDGHAVVALGGMSARILSELVSLGGPAPWAIIAGELWRDITDELPLRRRWDRNLARLRIKLREGGVRPDLIRSDGSGQCELFLYDGDITEDRT